MLRLHQQSLRHASHENTSLFTDYRLLGYLCCRLHDNLTCLQFFALLHQEVFLALKLLDAVFGLMLASCELFAFDRPLSLLLFKLKDEHLPFRVRIFQSVLNVAYPRFLLLPRRL